MISYYDRKSVETERLLNAYSFLQDYESKTSYLNQLYQGSSWAPPSVEYKHEGVALSAILEKREEHESNRGKVCHVVGKQGPRFR